MGETRGFNSAVVDGSTYRHGGARAVYARVSTTTARSARTQAEARHEKRRNRRTRPNRDGYVRSADRGPAISAGGSAAAWDRGALKKGKLLYAKAPEGGGPRLTRRRPGDLAVAHHGSVKSPGLPGVAPPAHFRTSRAWTSAARSASQMTVSDGEPTRRDPSR